MVGWTEPAATRTIQVDVVKICPAYLLVWVGLRGGITADTDPLRLVVWPISPPQPLGGDPLRGGSSAVVRA